jgi:hypothetical protein
MTRQEPTISPRRGSVQFRESVQWIHRVFADLEFEEREVIAVNDQGTRRLCAVDPRGIEALRNWLDGFWGEAAIAFKEAAEREAVKEMTSAMAKKKRRKPWLKPAFDSA